MRIGLGQVRFPNSALEGVYIVKTMMREAANKSCDIVCFPESIIPGLRGVGYEVEAYNHETQKQALQGICDDAKKLGIAVILPMEWKDELGYHLVAFVINEYGDVLGYQTKNQIDPDEDQFHYVPGEGRHIFEEKGVKFGIVICHEGWRYPETVRWAALQGASIVFHPQFTGDVKNPAFFNGAMVCRSLENNIYFASVNYALENQKSTTSLISPSGERLKVAQQGKEELLVYDVNPSEAHRLLTKRFRADLLR
ncbi:carbon-nitrogen hydrolase family protein [Bacillus manliponensis]|uniref:carbon-nitrogen hydrolase family protein n=1 Tax=Bacillus manliponensis TaxID=574376 RepID=UPI0035154E97